MDTMRAFAMGEANRGKEHRVFDWDKARALIEEHQPETAFAGLSSDLEWTGGYIWKNGKPIPAEDTYTYLSSNWAIPVIVLDDGEEIDCWRMQSEVPNWNEVHIGRSQGAGRMTIDVDKSLELDNPYSDWKQAFCYANGGIDTYGGAATPDRVPGAECSEDPFDRTDVAELYGCVEGHHDEESWICYGKLIDGRYFALTAWCDYTGWD